MMLYILPFHNHIQYNFSSYLNLFLNHIMNDEFLSYVYYHFSKSKIAQFDCIDERLFIQLI